MLAGFRSAGDSSSPYKSYRCKDTAAHDDRRASARADETDTVPYNILTNNCLTRSLEIFQAYDGTGDLASLGDGRFPPPRWYFDNDLDGFDAAAAL